MDRAPCGLPGIVSRGPSLGCWVVGNLPWGQGVVPWGPSPGRRGAHRPGVTLGEGCTAAGYSPQLWFFFFFCFPVVIEDDRIDDVLQNLSEKAPPGV
uniref:Uncharacterized protein n=1 Tax=Accipiter nisus TaxID=211598 RepID=A0A8B9NMT4_9AVES